ncbi:hypothetical protein [Streptomyces sp. NA02950]|nr:hypothetical protein [Streptomyces sp. NA02950]
MSKNKVYRDTLDDDDFKGKRFVVAGLVCDDMMGTKLPPRE